MDFDIVIATRNRQGALALSLPLMLKQSRLPDRLVIVDASDDGALTRRVAEGAAGLIPGPFHVDIIHSEVGLCRQRNLGLAAVRSPVVFFPDDDALWFPGYADAVMAVYERDTDGLVGAVGGTESKAAPPGLLSGVRMPTDGLSVRLPGFVSRFFDGLESVFFPDPFFLQARVLYRERKVPVWLSEEGAAVASTITGFRMSFRRDVIAGKGFDETLSRYGLFEDHDACMGVLSTHCIVRAKGALVFHNRPPEKRADELELGVMHLLNRAYIVRKHSLAGFDGEGSLRRYACYKLALYALRAKGRAGRRRFLGAFRAARCIPSLWRVPPDHAAGAYLALRERCLDGR